MVRVGGGRREVLSHHPDRDGAEGEGERFIAVRGAWEVRAYLTQCIYLLVLENHSTQKNVNVIF